MAYNTPAEIASLFAASAISKNKFSTSRLMVYSLLGGAFIGFGGLLAIMVAGGMPGMAVENPGLVKFFFGAVFPLGLFMVVLGGAELFTSDCAVISLSVFRGGLNLKQLVRIWTLVYIGNFAGAVMMAYLFGYYSGIFASEPWLSTVTGIGEAKTSYPFMTTLVKAIGANWLVCMAVWMSTGARDVSGKILAIWFPIMGFVVLGFEHSIANMFFLPAALFMGADFTIANMFLKNLIPVTLGNIIGAVVFVAMAYGYVFSTPSRKKDIKTPSTYSEDLEKVEQYH